MKSSVEIRAAREQDCATLHGLVRELAEYEKLTHLAIGTQDDLHAELFSPRPVIEAALAWDGTRAVGYALWFHTYSSFLARRGLYLEDIFVVPDARGRGTGKALMLHCARLAIERGCGRFEWVVLDWNTPSIAFYESIGATVLPEWRVCRMSSDALERFVLA